MRPGFALLDLVAAMVIGTVTLTAAAASLIQVSSQMEHMGAILAEADRLRSIERTLRHTMARLDHTISPVTGTRTRVDFTSWCESPFGGLESCRATLEFRPANHGHVLVFRSTTVPVPLVLADSVAAGSMIYMRQLREGGAWLPEWINTTEPPRAIGAVLDGDTLIIDIGVRG